MRCEVRKLSHLFRYSAMPFASLLLCNLGYFFLVYDDSRISCC